MARSNGHPIANVPLVFMRQDLQSLLHQRAIDPLGLGALQRVLLTTDGTVTEILEACAGEPMRLVKLHQTQMTASHPLVSLDVAEGEPVLNRNILLQGTVSHRNFLYAESVIALHRLPPSFQHGLLASEKPIGQLLLDHQLETFKEILDCGKEPVGALAHYFHVDATACVIVRTYRTFASQRPVMLITEKFLDSDFLQFNPVVSRSCAPG